MSSLVFVIPFIFLHTKRTVPANARVLPFLRGCLARSHLMRQFFLKPVRLFQRSVLAGFQTVYICLLYTSSVPAPMAMPISALVRAGASLIPSPTMATFPFLFNDRITLSFPSGSTPAITSSCLLYTSRCV